jgi:hypothetical protein
MQPFVHEPFLKRKEVPDDECKEKGDLSAPLYVEAGVQTTSRVRSRPAGPFMVTSR